MIYLFKKKPDVCDHVLDRQFTLEETEPLYIDIHVGRLFPSYPALYYILRLLRKGKPFGITFHLKSGLHFDVYVEKPYRLRRYKKGDIVKVYE